MDRIDEALDICFTDVESHYGRQIFILFTKLDVDNVDAKKFNEELLYRATNVFMSKNMHPVIISRLSSLILYSIKNFPNDCNEICGVIIHLLRYLTYPGILELFADICEYNSPLVNAQTFLKDACFSHCVMSTLKLKEGNREAELHVIQIIRMCSGNPILMDSFKQPEIVSVLMSYLETSFFKENPVLWRCLTGLINENTNQTLKPVLIRAVDIAKEDFNDVKMFRIFAMDFIGKFIIFDKSVANFYIDGKVLETASSLMIKFSNCTNLISSIFRLFNNSFVIPIVANWMMHSLIPLLMSISMAETRFSAKSAALHFLIEIAKKAQVDKNIRVALESIPGYKIYFNEKLLPYNEILMAKYGGRFERHITRKPSTILPD